MTSPISDSPSTKLDRYYRIFHRYIVPAAFIVGGLGLITIAAYDILTTSQLGLLSPTLQIIVGSIEVGLGLVYAWTFKAQDKHEEQYQAQKEWLEQQKEQLKQDNDE